MSRWLKFVIGYAVSFLLVIALNIWDKPTCRESWLEICLRATDYLMLAVAAPFWLTLDIFGGLDLFISFYQTTLGWSDEAVSRAVFFSAGLVYLGTVYLFYRRLRRRKWGLFWSALATAGVVIGLSFLLWLILNFVVYPSTMFAI